MILLQEIKDPQSEEDLSIQLSIMNSQPLYNQIVVGKDGLTTLDIQKDNKQYLNLGAKYLYIIKNKKTIGIIHYLLKNPSDHCPWIGLFIVYKEYEKSGVGSSALYLLEE